ncbi:ribonuclease E inhibitor RraB [Rheinheimera sediminis]|jgi:regulator of RNase E activity RraB|uniref:ribonuclease E inhibitor RraB n=1 Tax=Rheinheimera sp. YQF-1 TaxID=2499626 RepID=UPI000FDBBF75|nr:ribonuclease E inhibitor RraB [Rheinheimera sp. YQF-1]RVT44972.1 ribonuclease E inhibitor RraB [Rheinheimera sp. YQF-1]
MQFPDDGNGDMLRALMDAGIDLSQPLAIDFYLVFKNKDQAEKAMAALVASDLQGEVELHFNDLEQWELIVSQTMLPEHEAITAREAELDKFAKKFGGHNDGWGVMQHQDGDDDFDDEHGDDCDHDCGHQH